MNYLKQFAIILFVSFLGELLHILIPLPIPASVYGLLLMLLALCLGILRLEQVKENRWFPNRNYASYVYPCRCRTSGILVCTATNDCARCCDYDSDYSNCDGCDRAGYAISNSE